MEGIINVISDSNYRSKFLDALYDLRTSLAIKRILNKTIPVSKFKEMLVTVKSNYDDKIKDAIDMLSHNKEKALVDVSYRKYKEEKKSNAEIAK